MDETKVLYKSPPALFIDEQVFDVIQFGLDLNVIKRRR